MLPPLIAHELHGALSGYLWTTFALADDNVRLRHDGGPLLQPHTRFTKSCLRNEND
jgi:hypothetical protein